LELFPDVLLYQLGIFSDKTNIQHFYFLQKGCITKNKKSPRHHGTKKLRVATHFDGLPRPLALRCMGRPPRLSPTAREVDTCIPRTGLHLPPALFDASHTMVSVIAVLIILHAAPNCKSFLCFYREICPTFMKSY
ncbi:MAG: hypothetical protein J6T24_06215, partial [Clostridia bacterium]|nr:hypothetical protein [Clostridia bacterium]